LSCPAPLLYCCPDEDLSDEDRRSLRDHAQACASCRGLSEEASLLLRRLREQRPIALSACREALSLARYLQRALPAAGRAAFEEHLLDCNECLSEMAGTLRGRVARQPEAPLLERLLAMYGEARERGGRPSEIPKLGRKGTASLGAGRGRRGSARMSKMFEEGEPRRAPKREQGRKGSGRLRARSAQDEIPKSLARDSDMRPGALELEDFQRPYRGSGLHPAPNLGPRPDRAQTQPVEVDLNGPIGEDSGDDTTGQLPSEMLGSGGVTRADALAAVGTGFDVEDTPRQFPEAKAPVDEEHFQEALEISQKRQLIYGILCGLVGALLTVVLVLLPMISMTKDLYKRARRAEYRYKTIYKKLRKVQSGYGKERKKDQLKRLRVEQESLKLKKALSDQIAAQKSFIVRQSRTITHLRKKLQDTTAGSQVQLKKSLRLAQEQVRRAVLAERNRFPGKVQALVVGKSGELLKNEEAIILVAKEDDARAIAAFYVLRSRRLGSLAVRLCQERRRLSLMNRVGRAYAGEYSEKGSLHAQLISLLMHSDPKVRGKTKDLLGADKIELFSYQSGEDRERRRVQVGAIITWWQGKFSRDYPIKVLADGSPVTEGAPSEEDEGRWKGGEKK